MEYNNPSREREGLLDLESGKDGSPEDLSISPYPVVTDDRKGNRFLNKLASGVVRYNIPTASRSDSDSDKPCRYSRDNSIKLMVDKIAGRQREDQVPLLDKEFCQVKPQSTNSKKASKPPRPPKGPSLDASDLMLVKEISELVMKKRERKEQIKAFKRSRAAKPVSSSSSSSSYSTTLCALIVTVVFLLIIIFQGISWRNSSNSILHGSPGPTTGTDGLISVQVFSNLFPNHGIAPSSESPSSMEQNIGSRLTSPS